jgi:hypothetical protein
MRTFSSKVALAEAGNLALGPGVDAAEHRLSYGSGSLTARELGRASAPRADQQDGSSRLLGPNGRKILPDECDDETGVSVLSSVEAHACAGRPTPRSASAAQETRCTSRPTGSSLIDEDSLILLSCCSRTRELASRDRDACHPPVAFDRDDAS